MNTSNLGIWGGRDIWAFWRKKGETGSWSSLHPKVGEMSRYQVAHLEHQGMAQPASPAQFIPFVWVPNSLGFLRVPGGRLPSSSTHTGHLVSGVGSSLKIPTTNWRTGPMLEVRAW